MLEAVQLERCMIKSNHEILVLLAFLVRLFLHFVSSNSSDAKIYGNIYKTRDNRGGIISEMFWDFSWVFPYSKTPIVDQLTS